MWKTIGALVYGLTFTAGAYAVEKTETLDNFHAISYALPFAVAFVKSGSPYVKFDGDEDVIAKIEIEVKRGTLYLSKTNDSWRKWPGDDDLEIVIGYDSIDAITLAGSGNGHVEAIDSADTFTVKIAGSASLRIEGLETDDLRITVTGSGAVAATDIDTETVDATIAGSGNVKLTGTTVSQSVTISGSGDHDARHLQSNIARAKVRGSGDVIVWVSDVLDATVMGSGDIDYYGDAKVSRNIMGSGDLRHRGQYP